MRIFSIVLVGAALLFAGCDKDRNKERTGIEDHPKGDTNISGMDASGPASARTNPPANVR